MRKPHILLLILVSLTVSPKLSAQTVDTKGIEFFETKIRPVLVEHCYRCHSEDASKNRKLKAGLKLDTKADLLKGGESGAAIVANNPEQSLLLKALRHEGDLQMPPSGKLSPGIVNDFATWIKLGVPDPRDGKNPAVAGTTDGSIDWEKARQFWAFQLPIKHPVPNVKNARWPTQEIDHFILAELEKRNLKPVGPASKRDLIRRATFDLIGLPPTLEEVDDFLKDESADAFAKVVDRLLASPHHGERWGRYWLDVARYAEDKALAFVTPRPHAYRYRDWVVQAFNRDMPYDRFIRLQIAGDLVQDPEPDYFVKLAGLGFQGLGQEYHRGNVPAQVIADELDDRVDTLTRGLLGLTVACARCHDHKYDPIPTRDYYSLASAYHGSNLTTAPLADSKTVEQYQASLKKSKEMEANLNLWVKEQARETIKAAVTETGRYLQTAWKIRVLQGNKIPSDIAAIAQRDKLHKLFLERSIKLLEEGKFDKQDVAVKAWLDVMAKVDMPNRASDWPEIPASLVRATEDLNREIATALMQLNPKNAPTLLKTLWLNADAIFFVPDKDNLNFLSESARSEHVIRSLELQKAQQEVPPAPPEAHVVSGGGSAMKIYVRGNVERMGEQAPPGFPRVISAQPTSQKFTRLELADAIASPKNPLTARVIVNRVWHYHFGRGIVGTTSNFGQLGDRPSHAELLDTLTVRFMESGWSLHWLHRELMLSTAYRLASTNVPGQSEKDPDNQYLWRYTPRRLDFEAWRDSWLAVSGLLNTRLGGPSIELNQADNVRRTIYAKISRLEPNKLMVLFDFPDSNVTSDQRTVTTVPQQQLFVLNSDFTVGTAKAFARRLEKAVTKDDDRIALAFRLAYSREPSEVELRASFEFINGAGTMDRITPWEQFTQAILASNEFLWVD